MKSIASGYYPRRVSQGGRRLLWNPITRKGLRNRPEERVRQRVIEFLLDRGWPRTRISTEESRPGPGESRLRTDILCYSSDFKPSLLIECKAESVTIDEKTSLQTARYNREVGAPWLLMTNARRDFWYKTDDSGGSPERLEKVPELFEGKSPESPGREPGYWTRRGFLGDGTPDHLAEPVALLLNARWARPGESVISYLSVGDSPTGYPVDQYYLICRGDSLRIALAPVAVPGEESTRFVALVNREGENTGLMEIRPAAGGAEKSKVRLFTAGGEQDLRTDRLQMAPSPDPGLPERWAGAVESIYLRHA